MAVYKCHIQGGYCPIVHVDRSACYYLTPDRILVPRQPTTWTTIQEIYSVKIRRFHNSRYSRTAVINTLKIWIWYWSEYDIFVCVKTSYKTHVAIAFKTSVIPVLRCGIQFAHSFNSSTFPKSMVSTNGTPVSFSSATQTLANWHRPSVKW